MYNGIDFLKIEGGFLKKSCLAGGKVYEEYDKAGKSTGKFEILLYMKNYGPGGFYYKRGITSFQEAMDELTKIIEDI